MLYSILVVYMSLVYVIGLLPMIYFMKVKNLFELILVVIFYILLPFILPIVLGLKLFFKIDMNEVI